MSLVVPDDVGFAVERGWRVWHATRGIGLIALTEMSGRNAADRCAPSVFMPRDFLILPDFEVLGQRTAQEVKTRSYSPWNRRARTSTTGMMPKEKGASGEWYLRQYRRFEELHQVKVEMFFVHLVENEIRGGSLDEIEPAKTDRVNLISGGWFYEWDLLPRWPKEAPLTVGQMLREALAGAATLDARAARYFTLDAYRQIERYRAEVAIPAKRKHDAEFRQVIGTRSPNGTSP